MRTILVLAIAVLLASTVTVKAQEQAAPVVVSQTTTWAQFLEKFEFTGGGNHVIYNSLNEDPQPEIARVAYFLRRDLEENHPWASATAFFAMKDFQRHTLNTPTGTPPVFVITSDTTQTRGKFITARRIRFWKRDSRSLMLISEVEVRVDDLQEGTRKLLWSDDSEPMGLFNQWLIALGNTKRVRFLFYVYRGREPGGLGLQVIYDVPLAP